MYKTGEASITFQDSHTTAEFFNCHCGFKTKLYNKKTWALKSQKYYEMVISQKPH